MDEYNILNTDGQNKIGKGRIFVGAPINGFADKVFVVDFSAYNKEITPFDLLQLSVTCKKTTTEWYNYSDLTNDDIIVMYKQISPNRNFDLQRFKMYSEYFDTDYVEANLGIISRIYNEDFSRNLIQNNGVYIDFINGQSAYMVTDGQSHKQFTTGLTKPLTLIKNQKYWFPCVIGKKNHLLVTYRELEEYPLKQDYYRNLALFKNYQIVNPVYFNNINLLDTPLLTLYEVNKNFGYDL